MNTQSLSQIFQNSKLLEASLKSNYLAYNKFCEIKRTILDMADSLNLDINVLAVSYRYTDGAIAMYISIKLQCLKILITEGIPDDVKNEIIKISSKFNI